MLSLLSLHSTFKKFLLKGGTIFSLRIDIFHCVAFLAFSLSNQSKESGRAELMRRGVKIYTNLPSPPL